MRHNYQVGQVVNYGNKKVTIEDQREFWGTPSYRVVWFERDEKDEPVCKRAHLKELEIG